MKRLVVIAFVGCSFVAGPTRSTGPGASCDGVEFARTADLVGAGVSGALTILAAAASAGAESPQGPANVAAGFGIGTVVLLVSGLYGVTSVERCHDERKAERAAAPPTKSPSP